MNRIDGKFEKFGLYILSLWFLFVMLILITAKWPLDSNNNLLEWPEIIKGNWVALISLLCIIWGGFHYARFSYKLKGANELPTKVLSSQNINSEHLIFLATYIIPLVTMDFSNPRYVFTFLLLLTLMGAIYLKTNMFYANPTLAVIGYQIYKVTINPYGQKMEDIILISREKISVGESVKYKKLDDQIFFAKKAGS